MSYKNSTTNRPKSKRAPSTTAKIIKGIARWGKVEASRLVNIIIVAGLVWLFNGQGDVVETILRLTHILSV